MNPERLKQIETLLARALELHAFERKSFLEEACAGNPALQADLETLIGSDERAGQSEHEVRRAIDGLLGDLVQNSVPLPTSARIGSYEIVREVGRGGMGAVYLAQRADETFTKNVAIKVIKRGMDTDDVLGRFCHERQILANLEHPNIARLLDGGTTSDQRPYFVMEYVEGLQISEHCDRHNLSLRDRLRLFRTVCSAVHYAHQNLVVHRDLKPTNILVTAEGVPKLLDFGIAKVLEPDSSAATVTAIGLRPLTPEYASPEQIRGEFITTASDIYSLGIILHELLTGCRPQSKRSIPSRTGAVLDSSKALTAKIFGRLPHDLENIVLKATHEEPQRRYVSVEQFSEDIRRYLDGLPVNARKDTLSYRAGKFVYRHKLGVATAVVVFAIVFGFAITTTVQSARIARERDAASRERDRAVVAERLAERRRAEAEEARDAERTQRNLAEANLSRAEEAEDRAMAEAGRANSEADRARSEAETARQVSAFLAGMFEGADPSRSRGNTITAREILDTAAVKITKELRNQPKVQATLMNTMGRVYESLGLYASALPLHEEALKLRRQAFGNHHIDVAQSMHDLAQVLRKNGELARAEVLYRQSLKMQRELLGLEHQAVAETLDNLGLLCADQGRYEMAESFYRESLTIRRKILGSEHVDVAESLNNLGLLLWKKGDHQAAEPLHRQALAIWRKLLGGDHPKVAISLDNLALTLNSKGDNKGAEPLYREALAIFRKLYGNEHPDVAKNLNNLAVFLFSAGDYDGAEPLYREALAIQRKLLGEENSEVALSLSNLGTLLRARGDYAGAEPLYREALAIFRKRHGEEHRSVYLSMLNFARLLHDKGDLEAAEPLYRQASELRRKVLPEGHPERALSLVGLGQLLLEKERPQEAEPILSEGLEIRRKGLPKGHWRTGEAASALGNCLGALQRYDEAEPLLLEGYSALTTGRGEQNKLTQEALKRLIDLYEAWGKTDEAHRYRAQLPKSASR